MHLDVLTAAQVTVLDGLKGLRAPAEFYLAGGTALALRHGHRRSVDFDFFRRDAFDGQALRTELDAAFAHIEWLPSGAHTLHLRIAGVSTSFFRLPYPLLVATEPTRWGFGLAADADIAAMKLEAIAGRGSRKDFVDLRLLCRHGLALEDVFALFERKYGTTRTDRYHRLRALAYFDDAEQQPMPDMLVAHDWEETRVFFTAEAKRLLAAGVGS
jgi:hypothetical protein